MDIQPKEHAPSAMTPLVVVPAPHGSHDFDRVMESWVRHTSREKSATSPCNRLSVEDLRLQMANVLEGVRSGWMVVTVVTHKDARASLIPSEMYAYFRYLVLQARIDHRNREDLRSHLDSAEAFTVSQFRAHLTSLVDEVSRGQRIVAVTLHGSMRAILMPTPLLETLMELWRSRVDRRGRVLAAKPRPRRTIQEIRDTLFGRTRKRGKIG